MTRHSPEASGRVSLRRGVAMVETVLALPLLLVVLSLLLFFGRGVARVQRVHAMSQYDVRRQAAHLLESTAAQDYQIWHYHWQGPCNWMSPWRSLPPAPGTDGPQSQLDQTFFGGKAEEVMIQGEHGGSAAVSAGLLTAPMSDDAYVLAESILGSLPADIANRYHVTWPLDRIALWRSVARDSVHENAVMNRDWCKFDGWHRQSVAYGRIAGGLNLMPLLESEDVRRFQNHVLFLAGGTSPQQPVATQRFAVAQMIVKTESGYDLWRPARPHTNHSASARDAGLEHLDDLLVSAAEGSPVNRLAGHIRAVYLNDWNWCCGHNPDNDNVPDGSCDASPTICRVR